MTQAERQIRERALREAAATAHIWTKTYADVENSSNPELAKMFASVTRHAGAAIETAILTLIDQEPSKSTG